MYSLFRERRARNAVWICAGFVVTMASSPAVAFESQLRDEARYLAGKIAERGKTSAAVIDFTDLDGAVTHLGRFMAEELSVALAGDARSFRVVDRTHIRTLLKEHKLSATGLIDPDTARELGRIAGVDTLVTGTITPFGDSVRLSIKVLDSQTAQVIASSSCNVPKTQAIDSLLRRGVAAAPGLGGSSQVGASGGGGSSKSVEKEGVIFALQECRRSTETVTCQLVLTNQARDQTLYLSRNTRIFDPFGNEIYASRIDMGSRSETGVQVRGALVRGVPIKASATFEGLAPELRRLSLVEFNFRHFTVQFKDVPIS